MAPSPSAAEVVAPAAPSVAAPRDGWPDAPSRLEKLGEWLRPTLVVGLLTFAAGVILGNVLPTRRDLAGTERRLEDQLAENEKLRRRIVDLNAKAARLEKDPWLTEQILRNELKMSGDGEVIVR